MTATNVYGSFKKKGGESEKVNADINMISDTFLPKF